MAYGIGMAACLLPAAAQDNSPKRISFAERWAFKTNAVDWVLTTPNIGVEFDLSDKVYNKWTLGAQVKWNGGSNQDFDATLDYKMLDGRLELRRYWRTGLKGGSDSKRLPKFWRAYYWGIYARDIRTIRCSSRTGIPASMPRWELRWVGKFRCILSREVVWTWTWD